MTTKISALPSGQGINTASGTGTINSMVIGNINPQAATFTTITGALTGNASTATALATPRTIGGVSFDGTANIVPQTIESANEAADTTCFLLFITASGTQQLQPKNNTALTFNASTANLGCTTFTGALVGNADTASVASTVSSANEASDTTCFPLFITASGTQSLQPKNNTGFTYNSSTNDLGITKINGLTMTASTGTFTLTNAKTLSVSNTLTFTGTDSSSVAFGAGGTVAYVGTAQTFTAAQRGAFSTLTDAATVAVDLSLANNYNLTLGGSRTLGVPTNPVAGQTGVISVRQDITGSRTLSYSWPYEFPSGTAPTLSTGKLVFDQLYYCVNYYSTATVTVTIATPAVMTWTSHGLVSGQKIQLTTTGALPTGLSANTTYWVTVTGVNTFNLSTSLANAQAGTLIATSGSQSGTHTAVAFSITIANNLGIA